MQELVNIKDEVNPHEILLVVDGMVGQDVINVIEGFNSKLPLTLLVKSYDVISIPK